MKGVGGLGLLSEPMFSVKYPELCLALRMLGHMKAPCVVLLYPLRAVLIWAGA